MNYKETINFLASLEDRPDLGFVDRINPKQKPPIVMKHMHRGHLANLFRELGYRTGAEIGVCRGKYSHQLWKANPGSTIYSIDPWAVYPEYGENYTEESMEKLYQEAVKRLSGTGCRIVREFSPEAAGCFDDSSLDFVYIDGNHEFLAVTKDISAWSKKVRRGGILAGHDFARFKRYPPCHVKEVVKAWAYAHHIKPWFVLRGKGKSSWFWVVE